MSRSRSLALTLMFVAFGAVSARAQAPTSVSTPAADSVVSDSSSSIVGGPRIAPTGIQRTQPSAVSAARSQPQSMGKPMALMIVGGAAFVLGALIGSEVGTLFMLGGAVSFLIGLYEYVR